MEDDWDEVELYAAAAATVSVIIACLKHGKSVRRCRPKLWVSPIFLRRFQRGTTYTLLRELTTDEPCNSQYSFQGYLRMDETTYNNLFHMIQPEISGSTRFRQPVSAADKFNVTLRYLATGESLSSLSLQFRISQPSLSRIIPEVCQAIYNCLQPTYLKVPSCENEWHEVAAKFGSLWNFPNCLGAMDGKHVVVQKPVNSGSTFYTYKHTFAIQLLAIVDADYKFLYIDVGCQGRIGDAGVFQHSSMCYALENNLLKIPDCQRIPFNDKPFPFVFVADEAFPLKTYIMKPYARRGLNFTERIYNYRLSRARRVVENAFGILASRFRVFRSPILLKISSVEKVVLATTVLHNYLRHHCSTQYSPSIAVDTEDVNTGILTPAEWRTDNNPPGGLLPIRTVTHNHSIDAKTVRNNFAEYFVNEGQVSWQTNIVRQ